MTSFILIIVTVLAIGIWSFLSEYYERKTEKPLYDILKKEKDYEVRQYKPFLRAKIVVTGEYIPAANRAFGPLIDYIYGDNVATIHLDGETRSKLFGRTGIVMQMVAPVMIEKIAEDKSIVSFALSNKYDIQSVPKPKNEKIEIELVPHQKIAAITFSWFGTKKRSKKMADKLISSLKSNGIETKSNIIVALYNPPFAAPFLNRNEVMVEVE